ncbi:MAG TPA: glycosyltransferase [Cyclobacteriaceae bacterium]|nr:glycosyltransferase [Cyclobacteriaceae bacterium]
MEGVSIILCCYNSARRLPTTLKYLANQRGIEDIALEVIVVDNASTDDTGDVAIKEWSTLKATFPLRVIVEHKKGLSSARRRGIAEAKFDTLIFCDDDNWLEQSYASTAYSVMRDRSIGAAGGIGSPKFETNEPSWFRYVTSFYAVGDQANSVLPELNNVRYLYGAGMVVSKEAITALFESGFSNVTSDRVGNTLISGGDTEICIALQSNGYKIEYSEKLLFRHFIGRDRLTLSYCSRLIVGIGYSSQMLFNKTRQPPNLARMLKLGTVLLLPFKKYGNFFEKGRVFLFELGRFKYHKRHAR